MNATLSKWGNSIGIRIPVQILQSLKLSENDQVTIYEADGGIIIKKAKRSSHSFKQLMEEYYGKPYDEIEERLDSEEIDFGKPVGDEIW